VERWLGLALRFNVESNTVSIFLLFGTHPPWTLHFWDIFKNQKHTSAFHSACRSTTTMSNHNRVAKKKNTIMVPSKQRDIASAEIARLVFEKIQVSTKINWIRRVAVNCEIGLDEVQEAWGQIYGQKESPSNQRTLRVWCHHLLILAGRTDENSSRITGICKAALDDKQVMWKGDNGIYWDAPRETIVDWCNDILNALQEQHDLVIKEYRLENAIEALGWDLANSCYVKKSKSNGDGNNGGASGADSAVAV
jgi:hypothetical protein